MPRELKFIISPLLIVCFLVLSFGAGFALAWNRMPVLEAWDILKQDYVDQTRLDWQLLFQGVFTGVDGMLEQLDDPYTAYLSAEDYALFHQQIAGSFIGVGIEVTMDQDGNLIVIAPLPESPAEKAGIEPGDVILTIDGVSTSGMSLMDAVLRIRGKEGDPVKLGVRHQDGEEEEIRIIREEITIPTASWEMLPENIAYIEISHFSENTGADLRSYLEEALAQGAQGIILDLRNNPGGLVDAAVTVASQFLPEGSTVLSTRDGHGNEETWKTEIANGKITIIRQDAQGNEIQRITTGIDRIEEASQLPLVVLVNGYSASASEVVAGALQDYRRAKLIGTTTFGKGSVNLLHLLSDGSALYVTHGRWYTPNGRLIEGVGLAPDIEVEDDPQTAQDEQLLRALEELSE